MASALTTCAMMSIQPSEAKALTWWEYQALAWNWHDRHAVEGEEPVEAPDADMVARTQRRLEERGLLKRLH